uniref:[RNA-polymerase]-subunit kinase n=1 Tax=Zea mays TaxID=4577 RepID=A0A804PJC3_MAIZE
MGGLCSKEGVVEAPPPAPRHPVSQLQKASSQSLKQLITLTAKEEENAVAARTESNAKVNGGIGIGAPAPAKGSVEKTAPPVVVITSLSKSYSTAGAPTHHRCVTVDVGGSNTPAAADCGEQVISSVPQGFSGEHVIAGWPSWLTSVAGEIVEGWLPRRADTFERLDKIGQGTYSNVYKARDLQSGKIVALKRVRFVNMDPDSVRFMAREIHILRRLDHPNVIRLEGIVTSRLSHSLYLVFEYMEHDLAGLAALSGQRFTEPQVKCLMRQILEGLSHCHARSVLHRDIKGSNLLIDDNGLLRIADFGLATFFDPGKRQPMTSRVVTLWYRPPELLLGATEYGVAVDLWSTGCILAELLAGKPIMPGQTEIEQLHKIFKLCGSPSEDYWAKAKLPDVTLFKPQRPYRRKIAETFKDFPPSALALLDTLLAIEPSARGTVASALDSEFFRTKPLACDPASLPKYPPCKEYDAKLRGQEAKRSGPRRQGLCIRQTGERRRQGRRASSGRHCRLPAEAQAGARQPEEHQPPLQLAGGQRAGLPHRAAATGHGRGRGRARAGDAAGRRVRVDVVQERPSGGPPRVQLRQGGRVAPHLAAVLRAVQGHRPAPELVGRQRQQRQPQVQSARRRGAGQRRGPPRLLLPPEGLRHEGRVRRFRREEQEDALLGAAGAARRQHG